MPIAVLRSTRSRNGPESAPGQGFAMWMTRSAWQQLPRDARDTLFLLVVIAWTLLPHVANLPVWCALMAAAVLLWRARVALANQALPSRWSVVAVLGLATVLTLWTERTLLGKEAGVTMLVVLMALKTMELRARRDALIIFFLGFFLVLTHFLYSQSLLVALSMMVSVWGLLTALVLAHMPVGRPPLARAAGLAARTALLGAPVMVVLFVLFPRVGPLWGIPQDAAGRTGLSGSMRLGGLAEVANDDSIALRLRFFDRVPGPSEMYFRGPVLGRFDGREWTPLAPRFSAPLQLRAELQLLGAPLRYEMTIEPSRLPLLPLLEMTPDRPDAAPRIDGATLVLRSDLQWMIDRPVVERTRFEALAWLAHRHGPRESALALRDLVELPPGYNPRTLEWAAALRAQPGMAEAPPAVLAAAVMSHIRSSGFTYTLAPGEYGRDAIDEFWLDRKLGFCEHFSAAFVVIMRALDVPARVVTGYQGTDAVPVDGYWIVRQSNAHAWAEYWQPGTGWVRIDPTAAVAPDRIERGRSLAPTPGLVSGALGSLDPALAAQLRAAWEGVNNRWNQWVLNYSRGQQFDLMRELGVESPSWEDLAYLLILLLSSASLAGAGWAMWDRWRQDPWLRLQQRVQQRLAALGVEVQPHHPPRTRAGIVRTRLGSAGEALARELEALDVQRYAPSPGSAAAAERSWWARFSSAAAATTPSPRPR
jgi:protein-glutamine gamma-glutamyltransferase